MGAPRSRTPNEPGARDIAGALYPDLDRVEWIPSDDADVFRLSFTSDREPRILKMATHGIGAVRREIGAFPAMRRLGIPEEPSIRRWHVRSMTEEEAGTWIGSWSDRWTRESGGGWAIASASGLLGQISRRRLNLTDGIGEVSYRVLPAARGRRVATRALCALSAWVFDHLDPHRIELTH